MTFAELPVDALFTPANGLTLAGVELPESEAKFMVLQKPGETTVVIVSDWLLPRDTEVVPHVETIA